VQQVKAVSEAEKRLEKSKKEIESKNKPLVEVVEKIKRAEVRRRYGLCSCQAGAVTVSRGNLGRPRSRMGRGR
jgi:hypothetical protein